MSSLEKFTIVFRGLNVRKVDRKPTPHKACLLLAVIDQMETADRDNCFKYEPQLLTNYDRYFRISRPTDKITNARHPFAFLVSDGFWHLFDHQGKNLKYSPADARILDSKGLAKFSETVEYASLDNDLYNLLKNAEARMQLRKVLIEHWFPDLKAILWSEIREIRDLHTNLESEFLVTQNDEYSDYWRKVNNYRHPKFRKLVLDAYGYRCAATGWQLRVPSQSEETPSQQWATLLEAAHIMPVSSYRDNSINNGMALTPTLHLAMDRHLIAPGPDNRWHVSDLVQEQAEDDEGARMIAEIHKRSIILPNNETLHPTYSVLEWSLVNLRT